MEKKLTDEEIVKALEVCMSGECCAGCPYFENGIDCVRRSEKDTLDLIHRLQDENKRLTEELDKEYALRLKHQFACEKNDLELKQLEFEKAELQKQVEYWESETKIARRDIDEAVKDTAKEIYNDFMKHFESNTLVVKECVQMYFADKFGVEVE